jgi:hypothetical protein
MGADELGDGDHPLGVLGLNRQGDVLAHAAREELHVLRHHADLLTQGFGRDMRDVGLVEEDA